MSALTTHTAKTVLMVFGAWCAFAFGAALLWIGWVEWATKRDARRADKPIRGDDTILRLERATWDRR